MSARPMSLAAPPVTMPLQIGKYRITGLIGEGAMGVVYRAQDPDIQRSVAIKTIRAPLRQDEQGCGPIALRQFRVEAQAAGRLNHPNIVSIYECGEYGERGDELFIAMECVDGPSLASLLRQGARLALPDVMAVMLQLLDALQCAHEQRVWHCDIKPGNLLVAPDGRIKVTDFGIARVEASGLTMRNALWGSPGYMAPERYAGGAVDQRVDLFSCGVLLYELLTGGAPFIGSASAVMYQVLQLHAPPPSTVPGVAVPAALDAVVARALAKHPGERYASAAEMRQALLDAAPAVRTPRTLSRAALALAQPDMPAWQLPPTSWPAAQTQAPTVVSMPAAPAHAVAPADVMDTLEALLRPYLGAVTAAVVRQATREHRGLADVVVHIANQALTASERVTFLRAAAGLPGIASAAPQGTGHRAARTSPPPATPAPLRPETVDKAARLLAQQIGPIALLMARRAAAACSGREQFFQQLADSAGAMVDARALRAQFGKLD